MKPVPFEEAIAWSKARQVVLPSVYYGELQGLARMIAFSTTASSELTQLQSILDSLNKSLADGESYAKWKKSALDPLGPVALDLPSYRLETIFRTAIQGAYARGRCEQQGRTITTRPWFMYSAINDSRTRPAHAAMDGFVARYDDPAWRVWSPPCGYNCRCTRIALSDAQAEHYNALDQRRLEDPDAARDRAQAQPDPGWDYDPCQEPDAEMLRLLEEKIGKLDPAFWSAALAKLAEAKTLAEVATTIPQWVILEGTDATLEEIKALGAKRLDELLDLVTPDDRALFPAMTDRGKTMRELVAEAMTWEDGIGTFAPEKLADVVVWWRGEVQAKLAAVRPMGGSKFLIANKSGKGKVLAERVASKLPDDWVAKANQGMELKVVVNENPKGSLGVYHNQYFDRKTYTAPPRIRTTSGSTAEHEFIHHVQWRDQTLDGLFQAEHRVRNAGTPVVSLPGYGLPGRPDKYVDAYQGREYTGDTANSNGGALEVMTRAYQPILGDDRQANVWLAEMLDGDQDMLRLALGALFHYKPTP